MGSIVASSLGLLILLLLVPLAGGDFLAWQVGLFLIYGVAAQGVGFAWGRGGILPLGNALFFGLGAYGGAAALKFLEGAFVTSLLAILGVAILSALLAFGLAMLLFRGRTGSGPGFSLVTLALVLIAAQLAESSPEVTGGFNGMGGIPPIGGLSPFGGHYYIIAALVLMVTIAWMLLDRKPAGLVLRGLVSQEKRLELLGFAPHVVKAAVFAFSAFVTSLAGSLFASHQGIVTPQAIGFVLATDLVIWAAVGGRNHPLGPLLGAVAIGWISSSIRDVFPWYEVIVATLFLAVVLFLPGGAFQLLARLVPHRLRFTETSPVAAIAAPMSRASLAGGALSLCDVRVSAGGVNILNDLSLEMPKGKILCVIGPNGAGKTTMLNAITGTMAVQAGTIRLGEVPLRGRLPSQMLDCGIGRKFQVPTVFPGMSVAENLCLAMLAGRMRARDYASFAPLRWNSAALDQILDHPEVPLRAEMHKQADHLPQGHRQMLELAMAIAPEPRLLLLDEPAAGLSPAETRLMVALIRGYQQQSGAGVLVIEHDMALVEELSHEVVVLHQGRAIAQGNWQAIRRAPEVTAVYAGEHK